MSTRMDYASRLLAAAVHARDDLVHALEQANIEGPKLESARSTLKELDRLIKEGEGTSRDGLRLCRAWWSGRDGTPRSVEYHAPVGSERTYGAVGAYRETHGDLLLQRVEYAVDDGESPSNWRSLPK